MDFERSSQIDQQDFLSEPCIYKTLSNNFHKSTTSVKVITSINSKIKMYQFQKNGLFAD